jgi:hypothetical protein
MNLIHSNFLRLALFSLEEGNFNDNYRKNL